MARHRQKAQSFRLLSNKWLNGKCESTRDFSVVLCFRVHSLVHCFRFIHAAAFIPSTWKSLFPWKFMRWIVCSFWFGREYRNVVSACASCANDLIRIVKSNATHSGGVYSQLQCVVFILWPKYIYSYRMAIMRHNAHRVFRRWFTLAVWTHSLCVVCAVVHPYRHHHHHHNHLSVFLVFFVTVALSSLLLCWLQALRVWRISFSNSYWTHTQKAHIRKQSTMT